MSFLGKLKNTYKIQKDAKRIKKELKNIHIEAEEDNVLKVTINGEQEMVAFSIDDSAWNQVREGALTKEKFSDLCLRTLNRALKKSQEIAAQRMKSVWGEMMGQ